VEAEADPLAEALAEALDKYIGGKIYEKCNY
jgi:hypothetical protein